MQDLLDFFDRYVRGPGEALRYDDGFRQWSYTGDQVRLTAERFACRLTDAGLQPGDRLVIWSGDRPEWVAAFWGCMLRGITVVPLDGRASPELARRIVLAAAARGMLVGDEIPPVPAVSPTVFVWRVRDLQWTGPVIDSTAARIPLIPDAVAEIVFTSGTTGDPKGVVITHRNIVANITPLEHAVFQYKRYIWPFRPLRFLGLLPLSHLFGQTLTIFLPPLVHATVVFTRGYNPSEIARQIRHHRITLAVMVPRVLDMLRGRVQHLLPGCAQPSPAALPLATRLWRYRQAHRLFGWKFCGFVVGGAHLDPELEEFWRRLGFAVVQGYGLTETAPIVAWNNPFRIKHGTVGEPLEGVEVRIAPDGEVLVRGPSVTTGYLNAPEETRSAFEAGWFHTGDIGAFDESGHLLIRGRKKDVIVTAEGVHVFPEDVEQALEAVPGVREAAVVGRTNGGEHVHAVLVLQPGADGAGVVRRANAALDSHQRIKDFSVWPGLSLPRTEAIRKLKRGEIRRWVGEGAARSGAAAQPAASGIETLLARYAPNQPVGDDTTLDELGLSSLDRIELTLALEEQTGGNISEAAVEASRTVRDLSRLIDAAAEAPRPDEVFTFPRWTRGLLARTVRNVSQALWILPLAGLFMRLRVEGRDHLDVVRSPVIFAANHQSHLDTPAVLLALPRRWRRRVAVAMAREFFDPYFSPGHRLLERLSAGGLYFLAVLFFNAFPLPRTGPGARDTLRYAGELATDKLSILIFPEGHRTEHGEISSFQHGVGMMASRLRLPVIPVRLEGLERVLHRTWRWPRRGYVRVRFGAPLHLEGSDYAALAGRVEQAVTGLSCEPVNPTHADAA